MKKLIVLSLLVSSMWAVTDFSKLSTDKLISMRGKVPVSERAAFRAEMQKRLKTMTPAQRENFYNSRPRRGMGQGRGQGLGLGRNR